MEKFNKDFFYDFDIDNIGASCVISMFIGGILLVTLWPVADFFFNVGPKTSFIILFCIFIAFNVGNIVLCLSRYFINRNNRRGKLVKESIQFDELLTEYIEEVGAMSDEERIRIGNSLERMKISLVKKWDSYEQDMEKNREQKRKERVKKLEQKLGGPSLFSNDENEYIKKLEEEGFSINED